MAFSREKMLVSLVDNKMKSYMVDETTVTNSEISTSSLNTDKFIADNLFNIVEDENNIEDSNKSSLTINSNKDMDLDIPELENPQTNIFPSEENSEENLNNFSVFLEK
jgi:hypothetical protein